MKIEWHNGTKCYYLDDIDWSDVENTWPHSYTQFASCWWNREEKEFCDNGSECQPCETEVEADDIADAFFECGNDSTVVIYNDEEDEE